jgi:hypothetical protein
MNSIQKTILVLGAALLTTAAQGAITLNYNNLGGGGRQFTTSSGALLTGGSLQLGYFLDTGHAALSSGDLAQVRSQFIPLGTGQAGMGTGGATGTFSIPSATTDGRSSGQILGVIGTNTPTNGVPTTGTLVQGTRLFVLVWNAGQTEFGLFSDSALWLAPNDNPDIPGGASLTLAINATNLDPANASTELYHGTYDSTSATANFFRLEANIPEVSTSMLSLLAVFGLAIRRRR